MKWFALGSDGYMYSLGECSNFDEADTKADELELFAVWIFDALTAKDFVEVLTK